MKVLKPITSPQTISIQPRVSEFSNSVSIRIRRDGYGDEDVINNANFSLNGNFFDITFSTDILVEGDTYFIEITDNGELAYRDKIYVTAQDDFTKKHKQSQNKYTQYNTTDETKYVV